MQAKTKLYVLLCAAVLAIGPACSVSHHAEDEKGNKKVEIKTPFAEIKVGTDTDAKDTGMSPYPGARTKESAGDDHHRANVQIGGEDFGLKVVALTYQTDDSPDKVIDFYRKDLKRYGKVLECPKGVSESKGKDEEEIRCSDSGSEEPGKLALVVGVPKRQHLVAVKPNGKGTEFDLVYVNVRGKDQGTM